MKNRAYLAAISLIAIGAVVYVINQALTARPQEAGLLIAALGFLVGIAVMMTGIRLSSKPSAASKDPAKRDRLAAASGVIGSSIAVGATFFQPWGLLGVVSVAAGTTTAFVVFMLIRMRAVTRRTSESQRPIPGRGATRTEL